MTIQPPPLGTAPAARRSFEVTPAVARKAMITVACHRAGDSLDDQKADIRGLLEMLGQVEPTNQRRPARVGAGRARRPRSHTPRAIEPIHEDGTHCHHFVTAWGRPTEPDCTGRDRYRCTCPCGWSAEDPVKSHVVRRRGDHVRDTTTPTAAAAQAGDD